MNEDVLKTILQEGEGYTIEFKKSFTKEIDKEIVAFANSSGGQILIGIDDSGRIVGIPLTNDLKSKIYDLAQKCDPPIDIKLETFENIIFIGVKEGENKPYKCSKGFYIRNGANSQKMSRNQIMEFMRIEGRVKFDEIIKRDIDFEKHYSSNLLNRYLKLAGISKLLDDNVMLQNLSVLHVEKGKSLMNNAGILFFTKDPCTIHYHVPITCVLFKGTEKVDVLDRKDLTSDIITNIEDALTFLKKHLNLRYEITGSRRKEILEIPEVALREAVVNAVCHRDYFEKGANAMIEIYDDRVEISNPGGLPKLLKAEEFGKRSVARNPLIAMLLHRAGYIEKMGTGIMRIKRAMQEAGLKEPVFEYNGFFTVIFGRQVLKEQITQGIKIDEILLREGVNEGVNEGVKRRIEEEIGFIYAKGYIQRKEIEKRFGISTATAERDLNILKKIDFVRFEGAPKTGKYVLTEKGKKMMRKFDSI